MHILYVTLEFPALFWISWGLTNTGRRVVSEKGNVRVT